MEARDFFHATISNLTKAVDDVISDGLLVILRKIKVKSYQSGDKRRSILS